MCASDLLVASVSLAGDAEAEMQHSIQCGGQAPPTCIVGLTRAIVLTATARSTSFSLTTPDCPTSASERYSFMNNN
jgi:hypothetical protein